MANAAQLLPTEESRPGSDEASSIRASGQSPRQSSGSTDSMALHHGDVDGIAHRHQRAVLHDLTGPRNVRFLDSRNIVNDVPNRLESWPDGFPFCRLPCTDVGSPAAFPRR
jgi:hypothetical protein